MLAAFLVLLLECQLFQGSASGQERPNQQVTVALLHAESSTERPPDEAIRSFKKGYPFVKNTDDELKELIPRTILDYSKKGVRSAILDEFGRYSEFRRAQGQPVVSVNVRIIPWKGAFTRLQSLLKSGEPDIVMMPSTWCTYFITNSLIISLEQLVKSQQISLAELYEDRLLKACQEPGTEELFGLPATVDLRQLYVWKRIKRGKKEIFLLENPKEEMKTIEAFRESLKQLQGTLQKTVPDVRAFGLPNHPEDWSKVHTIFNWLWIFGDEVFDEEQQMFLPLGGEARAAIDYLGRIAPYMEIASEKSFEDVERDFLNGRYVIHIGVPNTAARLRETLGEKWQQYVSVISMPAGRHGPVNFLGGTYWVITSEAQRRQMATAAWDLVRFLTLNPESQKRFALGAGHLPATKEAWRRLLEERPDYRPFLDGLRYGRSFPRSSKWPTLEEDLALKYLRNFWSRILEGDQEAAAVLMLFRPEPSQKPDSLLATPRALGVYPLVNTALWIFVLFSLTLSVLALILSRRAFRAAWGTGKILEQQDIHRYQEYQSFLERIQDLKEQVVTRGKVSEALREAVVSALKLGKIQEAEEAIEAAYRLAPEKMKGAEGRPDKPGTPMERPETWVRGEPKPSSLTNRDLNNIGFEILKLIGKLGRASPIARVPQVTDWLRSSYPGLQAIPIRMLTEEIWLLLVLTADGKTGVVIPALDSIIGPGEVMKWYEGGLYDGTQALVLSNVWSLATAERDDERGVWQPREKGRIDLR